MQRNHESIQEALQCAKKAESNYLEKLEGVREEIEKKERAVREAAEGSTEYIDMQKELRHLRRLQAGLSYSLTQKRKEQRELLLKLDKLEEK